MQQTLFLKRFMRVEEMEVIVKHGHLTCEFTMWNNFVTEPMVQVKSISPYKIYRVFSWWDCFIVATNKWIVSCEVIFYVDQSEACMIVLCATIYMEHAHTCVDLAIWNQMLYEPCSWQDSCEFNGRNGSQSWTSSSYMHATPQWLCFCHKASDVNIICSNYNWTMKYRRGAS